MVLPKSLPDRLNPLILRTLPNALNRPRIARGIHRDANQIHPIYLTPPRFIHVAGGIPDGSERLASFGADSRNQTLSTLGPTTLENPTTTRRGHTRPKTVRTLPLNIAGLVGALHDSLLLTDARFYSMRGIRSRDRGRTITGSEFAPLVESPIVLLNFTIMLTLNH